MKKIIFIVPNLKKGGVQNLIISLSKYLSDNYSIKIISFGNLNSYKKELRDFEVVLYKPNFLGVVKMLHEIERVDILHTHGNISLFQFLIPAKKRIHTLHNLHSNQSGKIRLLLELMMFKLLKVNVISVTNQNNNYKIIHNSVGENTIDYETNNEKRKNILFAGRNDFQKNLTLFLTISELMSNHNFHVCGFNTHKVPEKYLNQKNLFFYGVIDDVWKVAKIDILLITSRFEGFPIVLLEAWIRGVFVISTPCLFDSVLIDGPILISRYFSDSKELKELINKALGRNNWNKKQIKRYYHDNLRNSLVLSQYENLYKI